MKWIDCCLCQCLFQTFFGQCNKIDFYWSNFLPGRLKIDSNSAELKVRRIPSIQIFETNDRIEPVWILTSSFFLLSPNWFFVWIRIWEAPTNPANRTHNSNVDKKRLTRVQTRSLVEIPPMNGAKSLAEWKYIVNDC